MRIKIYTDGACSGNPGPGGWGAILIFNKSDVQEISGFSRYTTNNRMELQGVIESLKLALNLHYNNIDIYTDSAYVVNAVKYGWLCKWEFNRWHNNSGAVIKNKDLWLELLLMLKTKGKKINLIKVKGHNGNKYNEMADQIARNEITTNTLR